MGPRPYWRHRNAFTIETLPSNPATELHRINTAATPRAGRKPLPSTPVNGHFQESGYVSKGALGALYALQGFLVELSCSEPAPMGSTKGNMKRSQRPLCGPVARLAFPFLSCDLLFRLFLDNCRGFFKSLLVIAREPLDVISPHPQH